MMRYLMIAMLVAACGEDKDPTNTDPTETEPTGTDPTGTDPTGTDPTGTDPTEGGVTGDWFGNCVVRYESTSFTNSAMVQRLSLDLVEDSMGDIVGAGSFDSFYYSTSGSSSSSYLMNIEVEGDRTDSTVVLNITQVYSGSTAPYEVEPWFEFQWDGADTMVGGLEFDFTPPTTSSSTIGYIDCTLTR